MKIRLVTWAEVYGLQIGHDCSCQIVVCLDASGIDGRYGHKQIQQGFLVLGFKLVFLLETNLGSRKHTICVESGVTAAASSLSRACEFLSTTGLGHSTLILGLGCRC